MIYYHLLTKEQGEEAMKLPNLMFQKKFLRPKGCNFFGALDRQFGCPFLFRSEKDRVSIYRKCKECPCRKEDV